MHVWTRYDPVVSAGRDRWERAGSTIQCNVGAILMRTLLVSVLGVVWGLKGNCATPGQRALPS
jgi:hypothetical protein